MLLELNVKLSCSFGAFSFFNFKPIVSDLSGEVLEKRRMRSEQVNSSIVVSFTFKDQEIILPQSFLITQRYQCPFVQRVDKLHVTRVFDKVKIVLPHFITSFKGLVLISGC